MSGNAHESRSTQAHPSRCAGSPDERRPAPLPSEALLRGRKLVEISHNGEVYRLQATRLGKLILTK
ncbi:MAG TPA: hemin uptake protein HemP [Ramlibacter sp.]